MVGGPVQETGGLTELGLRLEGLGLTELALFLEGLPGSAELVFLLQGGEVVLVALLEVLVAGEGDVLVEYVDYLLDAGGVVTAVVGLFGGRLLDGQWLGLEQVFPVCSRSADFHCHLHQFLDEA